MRYDCARDSFGRLLLESLDKGKGIGFTHKTRNQTPKMICFPDKGAWVRTQLTHLVWPDWLRHWYGVRVHSPPPGKNEILCPNMCIFACLVDFNLLLYSSCNTHPPKSGDYPQ